jgi:CRP-like cAMP-binding protein
MRSTSNLRNASASQSDEATYAIINPSLLRDTVIGKGLRADQLEIVALNTDLIELPAGETVLGQSENVSPIMLLLSGSALGFGSMSEVSKAILPGDMIGETILVGGRPKPMTVIAQEPSRIAVLSSEAINCLHKKRPDIIAQILTNLGEAMRADLRASRIQANSPRARFSPLPRQAMLNTDPLSTGFSLN